MKSRILSWILLSVIAGLIAFSLTGCGSSRKAVTKSTSDSTVSAQTVRTNTITTREKVDTLVSIPGDTAKASKPLDNLIAGDTLEASTNGTRVRVWYDHGRKSVYGEAITEPTQVPVTIDRLSTASTTESVQTEAKVSKSDSHIRKETSAIPWYFSPWPWLCLIVLVIVGYLINKYLPK